MHTHTHTYTCTHTHTHTQTHAHTCLYIYTFTHQSDFKKPGRRCAPGLKIHIAIAMSIIIIRYYICATTYGA